ncbi:hypothetical protein STRIP9103_03867 [Streptomyces ipomoeae 91-03]|uniref:Uncharacterized protein n=1 Tax=Streptomyces ipomoeae 91-03 TaxID=698759 RepID=L1L701_9ACTN|nr:hypothetical protein STRIP9103_03867 [Streptomyces ipomoeae 91-03]
MRVRQLPGEGSVGLDDNAMAGFADRSDDLTPTHPTAKGREQ